MKYTITMVSRENQTFQYITGAESEEEAKQKQKLK